MREVMILFFLFKQKTSYEMRISDWSSDVCSSDLSTRCWPEVETTSPATRGLIPKVRRSASLDPCSRRFFCAGAKTTRVAGFASALRTYTKSHESAPALARCSPTRRSEERRVGKECGGTGKARRGQ